MIPTIVLPINIINSIPVAIQNRISPTTRLTPFSPEVLYDSICAKPVLYYFSFLFFPIRKRDIQNFLIRHLFYSCISAFFRRKLIYDIRHHIQNLRHGILILYTSALRLLAEVIIPKISEASKRKAEELKALYKGRKK